jgi:CheY-like chemotaxis protein
MTGPMDRCLIVEENFLIRQDLADILQSLGVQNIDEAENISQAMKLIAATSYRFAFVDIIDADKSSQIFAAELKRLGIPLVVTTSYSPAPDFPPAMMDVPVISKPYSPEAIKTILLPVKNHSSFEIFVFRACPNSRPVTCRPSTQFGFPRGKPQRAVNELNRHNPAAFALRSMGRALARTDDGIDAVGIFWPLAKRTPS